MDLSCAFKLKLILWPEAVFSILIFWSAHCVCYGYQKLQDGDVEIKYFDTFIHQLSKDYFEFVEVESFNEILLMFDDFWQMKFLSKVQMCVAS